jgi:hypothetical protein
LRANDVTQPAGRASGPPPRDVPDPQGLSVQLESALAAGEAGLHVFPLRPRLKVPLRKGWQSSASRDPSRIAEMWRDRPEANVGVLCGHGLVVVEADGPAGEAELRDLPMPRTPVARSQRGPHFYFRGSARSRQGILPEVDVRGAGGYVVAPCSIHPSGHRYTWEVAPWQAPLALLPPALERLLGIVQPPIKRSEGPIPRGARNVTLTRVAGALKRAGVSPEGLAAAVRAENVQRCQPPLEEAEVRRILASSARFDDPPLWVGDPQRYVADPGLRGVHRLVLLALSWHAQDDGRCWPSYARVAESTGLHRHTIRKAVSTLKAQGRIEVRPRPWQTNVFKLRDPRDVPELPPGVGATNPPAGSSKTCRVPRNDGEASR